MNCAACKRPLTPKTAGELTVDACDGGCGGIGSTTSSCARSTSAPSRPARSSSRSPATLPSRDEFATETDRHAAADAELSKLFDGQLAAEHARSEAQLQRAQRFARAFRFLPPSWYLPGKQAGGAF